MRTREELEKEGKIYMFMDETPSRAADSLAITVNNGEYLVEVGSYGYLEYGLRIEQWQHTGEDEGEYVEIYYNPCYYDNEFVNGFGREDEGKQAFREHLIQDFEQMREYNEWH